MEYKNTIEMELQLHKFITNHSIEWHKEQNEDGESDVLIFVSVLDIQDFRNIIKGYRPDGGILMRLVDNHFGIWMGDICRYFGIDMDDLFTQ